MMSMFFIKLPMTLSLLLNVHLIKLYIYPHAIYSQHGNYFDSCQCDISAMCGIFCKYISNCSISECKNHLEKDQRLKTLLKSRGPDVQNDLLLFGNTEGNFSDTLTNDFCKTFMQLTGCTLWTQGNEPEIQPISSESGCLLFNGDIFDNTWDRNQSDTRQLFDLLNRSSKLERNYHILNTFRNLNGPFSLIYFDKIESKVYFCRDRLGRHSLLFYKLENEGFVISSILTTEYESAVEISCESLYSIDLNTKMLNSYSWEKDNYSVNEKYVKDWQIVFVNNEIDTYYLNTILDEDGLLIDEIEKYAKTFKNQKDFFESLLTIQSISNNLKSTIDLLSQSIKHRVETTPERCKNCNESNKTCINHCIIGILFSGGLDCTIIAAIANQYVNKNQPIDLMNVAFERSNCSNYDVPDRISARQSHKELQELFPERQWNLIELNIPLSELHNKQEEVITDLVHPLQTVLDESLGSALWFAARAETENYKSPCRVLLMGMGADELFGGYTRHRNAFKRRSWQGLDQELQMDWHRIAFRNLGRDDRVVSHHGRQPRMPYLDEKFSDFIVSLKPWEKCMPSEELGPGIGDKLLLRLVAHKIGLRTASSLPKKAIQFGSKIANKKESATDVSKKLIKSKRLQ